MVMHKLVAATIAVGSPFILWSALYLIARYSAISMRRIVPWTRVVRRLTAWTTLALFLLVLAGFPSSVTVFLGGVILIDTDIQQFLFRRSEINL
jgi:hypothetical protein